MVRVVNRVPFTDSQLVAETHKLTVKAGTAHKAGETVAEPKVVAEKSRKKKADAEEGEEPLPELTNLLARVSGSVRLVDGGVEIDSFETEVRDHQVDATDQRLVRTGRLGRRGPGS